MKKTFLIAAFLLSVMLSFGQVKITGHVWHDANGLTDLQINNSCGCVITITNGLNVYLVDAANNKILQAAHSIFENYTFYNVPANYSYKLVMSWTVALPGNTCPAVTLPANWLMVGENIGTGLFSGNDFSPNGILHVDAETDDIEEANFGIKQNF